MTEDSGWFAPKRYGYGAGLPTSWQGWAVTIAYMTVVLAAAVAVGDRPILLLAIVLPVTALLLVITARTTRGGWRWRWGDRD